MPWCMSGSLTRGGRGNIPGIPGACATRNFAYLVKGPWGCNSQHPCHTNESSPRIYKFVQPVVWPGFWLPSQLLRLATYLLFGIIELLRIYRLRFTLSFMIVWANVRFSHFSRVHFLHLPICKCFPGSAALISWNIKCVSIVSHYNFSTLKLRSHWNHFPWKTETRLPYVINIMVVDDLATSVRWGTWLALV